MFRIVLLALLALSTAAAAADVPPKHIHGGATVNLYKTINNGVEGWVMLSLAISESGVPTDVRIVASYPQGPQAARIAELFRQERFTPGTHNGVPVATTIPMNIVNYRSNSYRVRTVNMAAFNTMIAALRRGERDDKYLADVRAQYDQTLLNPAEVARYYYLMAPLRRMEGQFAEASQDARIVIMLRPMLGKSNVDFILNEEILDYVGDGKIDKAIELYETRQKRHEVIYPNVKALIEKIKAVPAADYAADATNVNESAAMNIDEGGL